METTKCPGSQSPEENAPRLHEWTNYRTCPVCGKSVAPWNGKLRTHKA